MSSVPHRRRGGSPRPFEAALNDSNRAPPAKEPPGPRVSQFAHRDRVSWPRHRCRR